jgi:hypothetical protein
MIDLNDIRAQFAAFLASNANRRHSLDAALMHVVEQAYQRGMEDGKEEKEAEWHLTG